MFYALRSLKYEIGWIIHILYLINFLNSKTQISVTVNFRPKIKQNLQAPILRGSNELWYSVLVEEKLDVLFCLSNYTNIMM